MEVDVKNALNNLLTACDAIDGEKKDRSRKIKNEVVCDIFSFIRIISNAGATERIRLFNTIYLNGDYEDVGEAVDNGLAVPASFDNLCQFDKALLKNSRMKTAALYITLNFLRISD